LIDSRSPSHQVFFRIVIIVERKHQHRQRSPDRPLS
jgi:hypothetical protein